MGAAPRRAASHTHAGGGRSRDLRPRNDPIRSDGGTDRTRYRDLPGPHWTGPRNASANATRVARVGGAGRYDYDRVCREGDLRAGVRTHVVCAPWDYGRRFAHACNIATLHTHTHTHTPRLTGRRRRINRREGGAPASSFSSRPPQDSLITREPITSD